MVMFRDSARRKAGKLGLVGFVKNEKDGSVYIEAEGEAGELEEFVMWCRDGSPLARVERVEAEEGVAKGFEGFEIRY